MKQCKILFVHLNVAPIQQNGVSATNANSAGQPIIILKDSSVRLTCFRNADAQKRIAVYRFTGLGTNMNRFVVEIVYVKQRFRLAMCFAWRNADT